MTIATSASIPIRTQPPSTITGALRRRMLGVSPDEARFERRGFAPGPPAIQQRLESVGRTFIHGYRTGLELGNDDALDRALAGVPLEDQGFAYEGAAMAFALLDLLTPWRRDRLARYLAGSGEPHVYMAHVGAGWALARLGRAREATPLPFDPLLAPLALDGYGFHEGYFAPRRTIEHGQRPAGLAGDRARAFDQGVGRSLWFVCCANPERIEHTITTFDAERHADLWAGIGLAAAYAGGVDEDELAEVRRAAGEHRAHVAQGTAFAAKARERALNPAPHTELACMILAGVPAAAAAAATDAALADVTDRGAPSAYETWRHGIRERMRAASEDA